MVRPRGGCWWIGFGDGDGDGCGCGCGSGFGFGFGKIRSSVTPILTEDDEVDNNYRVNYLTSAVGADGLEDGCGIWIQYCRYRG